MNIKRSPATPAIRLGGIPTGPLARARPLAPTGRQGKRLGWYMPAPPPTAEQRSPVWAKFAPRGARSPQGTAAAAGGAAFAPPHHSCGDKPCYGLPSQPRDGASPGARRVFASPKQLFRRPRCPPEQLSFRRPPPEALLWQRSGTASIQLASDPARVGPLRIPGSALDCALCDRAVFRRQSPLFRLPSRSLPLERLREARPLTTSEVPAHAAAPNICAD